MSLLHVDHPSTTISSQSPIFLKSSYNLSTSTAIPGSQMPDSVSVLPRIGENWKPCVYCCLPVTLHCDGICDICTTIEESRFRERENKKRKTSPMVSATTAVIPNADAPAGTEIVGPIEDGPVNKKPKLSLPPSIPKPANGVFETDEDLYAYIRENRERRWKFRGSFFVVADPKVAKNARIDTVFGALRKKAREEKYHRLFLLRRKRTG
ncbi:hypothetical protein EYR38_009956 [Pleurotus pulmonarius]|nr:hypothetical protein EYR38_009956 [Pleurotus pulmonarius]